MKHICDNNEEIEKHLQCWSKDRKHLAVSFFFWAAGTAEQRSYKGLLKAVLYKVLSKVPELMPVVFYSEWEALLQKPRDEHTNLGPISVSRLRRAFEALIEQKSLPLDLCIFIDGLDEYEGLETNPNREILEFVKRATCSTTSIQRIKMCLSSRPLNAFELEFNKYPTLRVQDLTRKDIALYVGDTINHNQFVQEHGLATKAEVDILIDSVVNKSSGVFLWARLSSNTILEGLENGDTLPELQAKVAGLPPELKDMFRGMIEKIGGYAQQAKNYFQLMEASRNPPSIFILAFAENDRKTAVEAPCEYWDPVNIERVYRRMELRLKSRCVGLLEVRRLSINDGTVQYLHRTVKDYLKSVDIWPLENQELDPHTALLCSYVLKLKRVPPLREYIWMWTLTIYECYYHARQAESTEPSYFKLLDELECAILVGRKSLYDQGAELRDFFCDGTIVPHVVPPMGISIWTGLYLYACKRITPKTLAGLSPSHPLLYYASCFSKRMNNPSAILDPGIIKLLLECGADPNQKIQDAEFFDYMSTTPWGAFLKNVFLEKNDLGKPLDNRNPTGGYLADRCLEAFELFLEFGAVPEAKFRPGWRTRRGWYDAWTLLTNLDKDEFKGTFKPQHRARAWKIKQTLLDKGYTPKDEDQLEAHRGETPARRA